MVPHSTGQFFCRHEALLCLCLLFSHTALRSTYSIWILQFSPAYSKKRSSKPIHFVLDAQSVGCQIPGAGTGTLSKDPWGK